MFKNIFKAARAHKIISAIIVLAVAYGGYSWYESAHGSPTVTKYVVQAATQGTVVVSVSGSGQVEPVTSITVKPQGSGNVTKIYVAVGQHVSAGQLLAQLDSTNEEKAVSQANLSLQSAQLSLSKLQEAPATTTLQQDEDAVTQAEQSIAQVSTTLATDYENGFDSISGAFVDFQTVMTQLQDFVQGTDLSKGQANPDVLVNLMPNYLQASTTPYRDDVISKYQAAYATYETNLTDYHNANRNSDSDARCALRGNL
jgi:multidrug efflux pump subunit AcrA (membrane-fusion protein)